MNKITVTNQDLEHNKITLNFTGTVKSRTGEIGEYPISSEVLDFETKLTTNKGNVLDLGILKGSLGDTGILIADVYLDDSFNLIIIDTQNKVINVGNTSGLSGDIGAEGVYPISVRVDVNNALILTLSDTTEANLGVLNTKILSTGDVVTTYRSELDNDTNYLNLNTFHFLMKEDYTELHDLLKDEMDMDMEMFVVYELFLSDLNIYMKAR